MVILHQQVCVNIMFLEIGLERDIFNKCNFLVQHTMRVKFILKAQMLIEL